MTKLSTELKIRIYQKSFNWNHLHLLIQIPSRKAYNSFIRRFSAEIAKATNNSGVFELRPYTRVVSWGRDFKTVKNYHGKNNAEAWGLSKSQMSFLEERIKPEN